MLPVIGTDPIRFNLNKRDSRHNHQNPPAESSLNCTDCGEAENPSITLYPITVEFDRLLRRQQQLKQCSWSPVLSSKGSKLSSLSASTGPRAQDTSFSPKRTTVKLNGHHSRQMFHHDSKTKTDPAAFLSNLDAHELLYATISHYYASLSSPPNFGTKHQKPGKNVLENQEQQSLEQIYRTLVTPGTRTMLLIADKSEIITNLKRENADLIEPKKQHPLTFEQQVKEATAKLMTNSGHYEADIEADENSDLESEHSSGHRKSTSKSTAGGFFLSSQLGSSPTNQANRHQDFCCPSSGINSSMSEDCLTASLKGDAQPTVEETAESAPEPDLRSHTTRKNLSSISEINSRSYRICKLMGTLSGSLVSGIKIKPKSDHHHHHLPIGIKMGVRGQQRSTALNVQKEETSSLPTTNRKAANNKNKNSLNGFDHFLDVALQRQQSFVKRFQQQLIFSKDEIQDDGGDEELLSCLGIEQQIVGAVTFYKSYRLTGIKVIELALISVRSQYRNSRIGSYLLRSVKQSGQIGPYDAIRVKVPTTCGRNNSNLVDFFLKNDFTDDLILNASFDQLDNVNNSDESEEIEDEITKNSLLLFPNLPENDFPENSCSKVAQNESSPSHSLGHSISFDNFNNDHSSKISDQRWSRLGRNRMSKSKSTMFLNGSSSTLIQPPTIWTSLCYLPPFSVATSLSRSDFHKEIPSTSFHHHNLPPSLSKVSQRPSLIGQLDNQYVDELIEEANGVWRRDILAAYRTQWSCVGRLRAEIARLRGVVVDAEHSLAMLKRENLQLRTKLLQSETSAQLNAQKHLFLLKNFNFDSLDF